MRDERGRPAPRQAFAENCPPEEMPACPGITMKSRAVRVIPGVGEVERQLEIRPTPFPAGVAPSFSLQGVWSCCRTRKDYRAWSAMRLPDLLPDIDYMPAGAGADVRVAVVTSRASVFSLGGITGPNGKEMKRLLDVAAMRQEVDRRIADGTLAWSLVVRPPATHSLAIGQAGVLGRTLSLLETSLALTAVPA